MIEENNKLQLVNVYEVLKSKSPRLASFIPKFIIRYIEKLIHQREINELISKYSHLHGYPFLDAILKEFGVNITFEGLNEIDFSKRYIIAANHPLGGLDGMALIWAVGTVNQNIVFPVNDILMYLKNLNEFFVPINKHGSNASNIATLDDAFASDKTVLYFPAGICSRKQKNGICDLDWKKSFINKALKHDRDIIPCFIQGENSKRFYNIANLRKRLGIKANIEMILLPDEMFKQKNKNIHITFGKPISKDVFDKKFKPDIWADKVKTHVYELKNNKNTIFNY